ncbi:PDDEXK nuclease domain-containing protein [Bradyrhizobium hipponense]|uniref:PDDEXK nuclease domain-containing protein n=1 Tax=Bradyrhizobium hipponense TaxID=2605638 RepID=UPI001F218C66|nr:PDDEXK nuclease domain-containing protein [Bradyrhizobium hipponense]
MNFYLSAVDDQLRHQVDQPMIGIILCKGRNEVIVEYALRDASKPMGVAQYQLSPALPLQLQQDLPTVEEFAHEFPLMSVVKMRVEIERALRDFMGDHGFAPTRPTGLGSMLRELHRRSLAPASTAQLLDSLRVMNEAAHAMDVDPATAQRAVDVGTVFLAELRNMRGNDSIDGETS